MFNSQQVGQFLEPLLLRGGARGRNPVFAQNSLPFGRILDPEIYVRCFYPHSLTPLPESPPGFARNILSLSGFG